MAQSSTFLTVDVDLERAVWEIFGTFTPGHVDSGGSL